MSTKNNEIRITNATVGVIAVDGGAVSITQSVAHNSSSPPGDPPERDRFERDVAEILHLLSDAQDELKADYESLRIALRKLNHLELESSSLPKEVQKRYADLLAAKDIAALRRIASSNIAANITSSALWSYLIQPMIESGIA